MGLPGVFYWNFVDADFSIIPVMPELERWGVAAAIFAETLILLAIGRALAQLLIRGSLTRELTEKDNAALALAVAGYYFGLFIALSGLLEGPALPLAEEMLLIGMHGLLGLACAIVAAALWRP